MQECKAGYSQVGLIISGLYNKIMWVNVPKNYSGFCKKGLKSNNEGIIADIGYGTLGFTYMAYAEFCKKNFYLCDLSYHEKHPVKSINTSYFHGLEFI